MGGQQQPYTMSITAFFITSTLRHEVQVREQRPIDSEDFALQVSA